MEVQYMLYVLVLERWDSFCGNTHDWWSSTVYPTGLAVAIEGIPPLSVEVEWYLILRVHAVHEFYPFCFPQDYIQYGQTFHRTNGTMAGA